MNSLSGVLLVLLFFKSNSQQQLSIDIRKAAIHKGQPEPKLLDSMSQELFT